MRAAMLALALSLISFPALAENTSITQWTGAVLANSTTNNRTQVEQPEMSRVNIPWSVPMFRTTSHERMTIKVVSSGEEFSGIPADDLAGWMQTALIRQAQSLAPVRNISIFLGKPVKGDLVLEVALRVISGKDMNRNSRANSHEEVWRDTAHSSSISSADSREWTKVYLTLQPTLYRVGKTGQKEIVVAPAARISASESEMTSSATDQESSRSDSYSWRGRDSSSSNSDSSSSEWQNDPKVSQEIMVDGLVQRLSRQTISLTFQDLCQALQVQRYGEIKDREATTPADPKSDPDSGISYTVSQ